ncbi:PD-(D/E)XK nuclease-like domain-containing protein [Nocardia pseudovaccinii]|uniref:PD-(D/E)XK nuclease-like domain-containing protein n=1 Tax=Nocardia pseudovaccinii TaxID=189540 RepID=UPI0007A38BF4|nr:PD-(D/E)XK nuclease-like domain-containing protein [Nocardia pseudovaccinii]
MTAPIEPGLYAGVPEAVYHGGPGISSSGARRLLQVTPHRWRWERENPKPPSEEMEFGTAVHTLVLGTGATLVDTGHQKWNTNVAKARVAEIRAAGDVPMRPLDFEAAHTAAANVRAHESASRLLTGGIPELSAYARDPETGVMLRARGDYVRLRDSHAALVDDLKTTSESGPDGFLWSVAKYGYHRQQAFYEFVFALLGIEIEFVFIVVCNAPPYEVFVVDLPRRAVDLGERDIRRALERYASCVLTDIWPSHADGIHHIDLPEKTYRQEEWVS